MPPPQAVLPGALMRGPGAGPTRIAVGKANLVLLGLLAWVGTLS